MQQKPFFSLKWQIFTLTSVVSAVVLLGIIVYWQVAIDHATQMNRDEDIKMAASVINTVHDQWNEQLVRSVETIAMDQRVREALAIGIPDPEETRRVISERTFSTGSELTYIRSYVFNESSGFGIPDTAALLNVSPEKSEYPEYSTECRSDGECWRNIKLPVMYKGQTVGQVMAAFPLRYFFSTVKKSRFTASITVISLQKRIPEGWRELEVPSMGLPDGFRLVGSVPQSGHINSIRFALNMAGIWGGAIFILMQAILIILLFRRMSYVKKLLSGFDLMLIGKMGLLKSRLNMDGRRVISDELDQIGERMVHAGFQLNRLRQIESRTAENNARVKAIQQISDERKMLLAKFSASEEERRAALARDLHDEVGSRLVSMRVDAIRLRQQEGVSEDAIERSMRIERNCLHLSNFLRSSIEKLCPPVIESLGLSSSVRGLVDEWASSLEGRTKFELHMTGDLDSLPGAQAAAAYRVVQEAMTNIAKYAQADKVVITIQRKPTSVATDAICIEIVDNGKGFDRGTGGRPGRGLQGMEERSKGFGGVFNIKSVAGEGTRIECCLPVNPEPDTRDAIA